MRATRLAVPAPAKLNLFLHITGKRADGYHNLQTLFQLLDWGDTLYFESQPTQDIQLVDPITGVPDDDNLIIRAAKLLQQETASSQGARICIDKQLPMGGGLGGGSSNAATTLLALNHLWSLDLPLDKLATLGNSLGADVPVFVMGQNSFAEGTGERLHPVTLPRHWYLVVKPQVNIETATIFRADGLTRDSLPIRIAAFFEAGSQSLSPAAAHALFSTRQNSDCSDDIGIGGLKNDCEPIACALYPEVANALDWLKAQAETRQAMLTGTGACVFARCDNEQAARQLLDRLPTRWQGFVSQSSARSSAHLALEAITASKPF